jgi:hypothetical protein
MYNLHAGWTHPLKLCCRLAMVRPHKHVTNQGFIKLVRSCLSALHAAGCRFVVRGVTTNMPHVRSCIANSDFKQGQYDTSFIPKYYAGPGAAAAYIISVVAHN